MKILLFKSIILTILFQFTLSHVNAQNGLKQAGICFRVDDNHNSKDWIDYASVFNKYGAKFCFALNLGIVDAHDTKFLNTIKDLVADKHEFMDHTPNHRTYGFTVMNLSDTILFSKQPGVDHINKNLICLKVDSINIDSDNVRRNASLDGNRMISANPGEFKNFDALSIYIPIFNQHYSYYGLKNINPLDPDTLFLQSFWWEPINIKYKGIISYKKLFFKDVTMNSVGISLLFKQTSQYCKEFGLPIPKTWIQPGGYFPQFRPCDIKLACESMGYIAAGVQLDKSLPYFNEYDPYKNRRFSMWGGNFNIETTCFKSVKTLIADGIAKHQLMFTTDHFGTYPLSPLKGGWNSYLQRTDSLLSWCSKKDIPIRTYKEWIPLLFDSVSNPFQNVFPPIYNDLDEDGYPDGYHKKYLGNIFSQGGIPSCKNYYIGKRGSGFLCYVFDLGGIEKGINKLEFYTKGNINDKILLSIYKGQPNNCQSPVQFTLPSNTQYWNKQSIEFNTPDSINTISILFDIITNNSDVKLSGISLRKKSALIADSDTTIYSTANLKIEKINLTKKVKENFYSKDSLTYTIQKPAKMIASLDAFKNLIIHKPTPFWLGNDAMTVTVENPDHSGDTIVVNYIIKEPVYYQNDTIKLQPDFITTPEFITISSNPLDPTITRSPDGIYRATPKINTTYYVEGKFASGYIVKDSLNVKLNQKPVSRLSLVGNNPICNGDSIKLTANNDTLKTEWYLNGTKLHVSESAHSISTGLPGKYNIIQADKFGLKVKSNDLVIEEIPQMSIKTQKEISTCNIHTFFVQMNCLNVDSIRWSTLGDGTITKVPPYHNILYKPGPFDLKIGKSIIKYTAFSINNCKIINDSITVSFKNPILSNPELKQGELLIPQNHSEFTKYVVAKKNADTITWTIEPRTAATLIGNDSICSVFWNKSISGQVKLCAKATNKCNYEATSSFSINLKNLYTSNSTIEEGIVDFSFFPNPVIHGSGLIKLNKYYLGILQVKIYNQIGELILEQSLNTYHNENALFTINLSNLPKGLYFIRIGNQTKKIIIQ